MSTFIQIGRDTMLLQNVRKISVQPQGNDVYALRINNSHPCIEGSKALCMALRENILDQLRTEVQIFCIDMGEDLPESLADEYKQTQ